MFVRKFFAFNIDEMTIVLPSFLSFIIRILRQNVSAFSSESRGPPRAFYVIHLRNVTIFLTNLSIFKKVYKMLF